MMNPSSHPYHRLINESFDPIAEVERTIHQAAQFLIEKKEYKSLEDKKMLFETLKKTHLTYQECKLAMTRISQSPIVAILDEEWNEDDGEILPTKRIQLQEGDQLIEELYIETRMRLAQSPDKQIEILSIAKPSWNDIRNHIEKLRIEMDRHETEATLEEAKSRGRRDDCCYLL